MPLFPSVYVKAFSIGNAVPQAGFHGVVHSVFRSTLNLALPNREDLITLIAANHPDLPQAIRLDVPEDFTFERFRPGETVSCDGRELRLSGMMVDLRHATRWSCHLPSLSSLPSFAAAQNAWRLIWEALNERQRVVQADLVAQELFSSHPPLSEIAHQIRQPLVSLLESARRGDSRTAEPALRSLIGLGRGLTPSGDDLLVGLLAGWRISASRFPVLEQFLLQIEPQIIRLSHQTNAISRTFLIHAMHGQVSASLAFLAQHICIVSSRSDLLEAFERASCSGHTSGLDAITGLLLGIGEGIGV